MNTIDWTQILLSLIGFVAGGGIVGLVTLKANRRKANAEADNAAVEPLKNAIDILNRQLADANVTIAQKDAKIEEKDARIILLSNRLTALYDDMCVHKGCKLRKPHQGQGAKWYEDHADDPSLGCDYLSVEWLLKGWRKRNASNTDEDATAEEDA